MSLPSFQLLRPRTLDEAIALMGKYAGEVKIIAGGTDLLPSMKQKLFTPPYVLDLRGIGELRGISSVPKQWPRNRRADHPQRSLSTRRSSAEIIRSSTRL